MHWFEQLSTFYGKEDIPLFHKYIYTDICVNITVNGGFINALHKREKTLVPVTERSACRTSGLCPHPLCDSMDYYVIQRARALYLMQLYEWAASEYGNEMLMAVYRYIAGDSLLPDISAYGTAPPKGAVLRFSVDGIPLWNNTALINSYIEYTHSRSHSNGVCCISGGSCAVSNMHPKHITDASNSAKLIPLNEHNRLIYSGKFAADSVFPIGCTTGFMAHTVLKRLIAECAVRLDEHIFVAWDEYGSSTALPLFGRIKRPCGAVTVLGLAQLTAGRLSVVFIRRLAAEDYYRRASSVRISAEQLPKRSSGYFYSRLLGSVLDGTELPQDIQQKLRTGNPKQHNEHYQQNRFYGADLGKRSQP